MGAPRVQLGGKEGVLMGGGRGGALNELYLVALHCLHQIIGSACVKKCEDGDIPHF